MASIAEQDNGTDCLPPAAAFVPGSTRLPLLGARHPPASRPIQSSSVYSWLRSFCASSTRPAWWSATARHRQTCRSSCRAARGVETPRAKWVRAPYQARCSWCWRCRQGRASRAPVARRVRKHLRRPSDQTVGLMVTGAGTPSGPAPQELCRPRAQTSCRNRRRQTLSRGLPVGVVEAELSEHC